MSIKRFVFFRKNPPFVCKNKTRLVPAVWEFAESSNVRQRTAITSPGPDCTDRLHADKALPRTIHVRPAQSSDFSSTSGTTCPRTCGCAWCARRQLLRGRAVAAAGTDAGEVHRRGATDAAGAKSPAPRDPLAGHRPRRHRSGRTRLSRRGRAGHHAVHAIRHRIQDKRSRSPASCVHRYHS